MKEQNVKKSQIYIFPNPSNGEFKINGLNTNLPDRKLRIEIEFGVAYGSNIDKVKDVALSCLKGETHVLKDPEPSVLFTAMADSALSFKLMFWLEDIDHRWPTHQSIITKLYNSLNKSKIGIPFPQRELWVHNLKK